MSTITIQIGNSDDKLKQSEWSKFISETASIIYHMSKEVHFFGTSPGISKWQNACWVIEYDDVRPLFERLSSLKERYGQDSIAVTIGKTEFI